MKRSTTEGQARTPLTQFRCVNCLYGASRRVAPERCPMCGGAVWEHEPWRPFGRGGAAGSQTTEPVTDGGTSREALEASRSQALVDYCLQLYARVEQLETALHSRIVIEQAKGVLAERLRLSVDEAFELLRLAARTERLRLHGLARQVVDEAVTPEAITRAIARQQRWSAASLREQNEAVRVRARDIKTAREQQADRLAREPARFHP